MTLVNALRTLFVAAAVALPGPSVAALISLNFAGTVTDTSAGFPAIGTPVSWTVRYDTNMTETARNDLGTTTSTIDTAAPALGLPAAVIHLPGGDLASGLDLSLSLVDNAPASVFVDNFHGFSSWSGGGLQYQLVYGNDMWETSFGGLPPLGAALPGALPPPPLFTIGLTDRAVSQVFLLIEGRAQPGVVDTPATLGLLGIGALAAFVTRRRARRA